MYEIEGKSINQIAKELNMRHETISNNLKKLGVNVATKRNQFSKGTSVNENKFEIIDSEESAYFLGLLYADGTIRKDRNEIALDLQAGDYDLVEKFHLFMENTNTIREHVISRNGKEYKSFISSFSSTKVKTDLGKLGCVPQKSLILTCPTEEQVPQKFFRDFVRGYIDGDGHLRFKEDESRYELIIAGTYDFLSGIEKRMGWEKGNIHKQGNIYYLAYYNIKNLKSKTQDLYLNSTVYMNRKYNTFLKILEH